jgi:hypothetical protein
MTTDVTTYSPRGEVAATGDPTGGRLVAWAQAASAAHSLARSLASTAFVPQAMRDPGNATAAILMGDELGMSPIASLRSIYVVHGTPALYARSMVALALAHGHEIWTEESTPSRVVVCGRRRGSEHVERSSWTQDRARKAGYTSNRKYDTNPEEMLYSKAAAEVARKVAADVLAGVPYSVEDLELEEPAATRTVTRSTDAKPRTVRRAQAPEPDEPALDEAPPSAPAPEPEPEEADAARTDLIDPKGSQMRAMQAAFRDANITEREDRLRFASETIGREIASASDLTRDEASAVIDELKALVAGTADEGGTWAGEDR